ncbi:MAG TPA: tetratricopeptide repeat protein [Pyrinomonadaceae bacterium]|jgi:Flp pilus assembly protein TadD
MSQSRIDIFAEMAREQPDSEMVWYGLANEYVKAERWGEAADALRQVVSLNPDYTAAYQLLGTALFEQGESEQARVIWEQGREVAERTGAWKARQHIEGLLARMDEGPKGKRDSEFCEE